MNSHSNSSSRSFGQSLSLWPTLCLTAGFFLLAGCAHTAAREEASPSPDPKTVQGKAVVAPVKDQAERATPASASAPEAQWQSLFDGKTLTGWKATDFAGGGVVDAENGQIRIQSGVMLSGITWTNPLPKTNYEIALEAMKVEGSDFFCGLTFPVGESHCSLIVGGWGGGVVGISSIDGADASENETTKFMDFKKDKWYRIRVRVTPAKIEAWIDDDKMVEQSIEGRRVSMRPGEIELSAPFGVATYQTAAALRDLKIRRLTK